MSQRRHKRIRLQEIVLKKKEYMYDLSMGIRRIFAENWKFLLVLCVGIIVLYFNSLRGDFVSDDYASITNNPEVMNFSSGARGLILGTITWLLSVVFGVKSPIPFHVFNLFLYLMVCVLAFIFTRIVFDRKIAVISTVLYAVLPIHVEAVSWISGKPYLLTSVTVLTALILFILYIKTGVKKYLWLFIFSLPITFLAERVRSISLIFLVILYCISFNKEIRVKINWGKLLLIVSGILLVIGVLLSSIIQSRIQSVNSGYNGSESIFYNPFFQYPTAIAKYLQLAFFPVDLTLYHTMYVFPVWLNWLIFLTYLFGIVYFFFKNKKIFFVLVFIFLATAPSMAPVKVSWLVAERYLLLGSLGFTIFLAMMFDSIWDKFLVVQYFVLLSVVILYGARTYLRNIDWQTNHNLWVNTCQVSPNSHNAWNNIGDDYDKLGQYENAIKGFTQSTVVKPNYADAYHNRANIFFKIGRLDLARDSYNTALVYSPGLYQTYLSLTQIDLSEKRFDLALEHSKKYLDMQPNDLQAWYVYGVVNLQAGLKDEAMRIFSSILEKYPTYRPAKDIMMQLTQQS